MQCINAKIPRRVKSQRICCNVDNIWVFLPIDSRISISADDLTKKICLINFAQYVAIIFVVYENKVVIRSVRLRYYYLTI